MASEPAGFAEGDLAVDEHPGVQARRIAHPRIPPASAVHILRILDLLLDSEGGICVPTANVQFHLFSISTTKIPAIQDGTGTPV